MEEVILPPAASSASRLRPAMPSLSCYRVLSLWGWRWAELSCPVSSRLKALLHLQSWGCHWDRKRMSGLRDHQKEIKKCQENWLLTK